MDKGRAPRKNIWGHWRKGTGASRGILRRVAMMWTTSIMSNAMHTPGTTPPKNKAPTEVPETKA